MKKLQGQWLLANAIYIYIYIERERERRIRKVKEKTSKGIYLPLCGINIREDFLGRSSPILLP